MKQAQGRVIDTVNFGELEVPDEKIISFKEGVPGFPQLRSFAIVEVESLDPFCYLQALGEPPVSLLLISPFLIDSGYNFHISESDMRDIRVQSTENVSVYVVATIPEQPEQATVNLRAPVLVNNQDHCGKQVILRDSEYSVRHPLYKIKGSKPGAASKKSGNKAEESESP